NQKATPRQARIAQRARSVTRRDLVIQEVGMNREGIAMAPDTSSMLRYCPTCNDDREFIREIQKQTCAVRGVDISADVHVLVCPECKDIQPDPEHDPMLVFYAAYREGAGFLS